MTPDNKDCKPKLDLEAEALIALEDARRMAPGAERIEAMKRAGILRHAVDLQGLFFAKRGRKSETPETGARGLLRLQTSMLA